VLGVLLVNGRVSRLLAIGIALNPEQRNVPALLICFPDFGASFACPEKVQGVCPLSICSLGLLLALQRFVLIDQGLELKELRGE